MNRQPPAPDTREAPAPDAEEFLADVLAGLAEPPYAIPAKYLYDRRGSELFDRICELEAYYPTRTELGILRDQGLAIGEQVGPRAAVIELGSGSSNKTRILLDSLPEPLAYIPVEIAREPLAEAADRIQAAYPGLEVLPVCADYHRELHLPEPTGNPERHLLYFPGSTIGNFDPDDAEAFLQRLARLGGEGGQLLIGVDLIKDVAVLHRAYDDPEGVTAAFNRNLLDRMQRELGAELDREAFHHQAQCNEELGCIEMHLVSRKAQTIRVGGRDIPFAEGQTIRTERSYKYTLDGFAGLAARAGWTVTGLWTDPARWFSVQLLHL